MLSTATRQRARILASRLALAALGVLVGIALIEAALLGASAWVQARRYSASGGAEAAVRVLCVGESTTQGAWWTGPEHTWPRHLERALAEARPDLRFEVINEGIIGTTSAAIVELLPEWLKRHDPHFVITMMGINDEGNVLVYDSPGAPAPPAAWAHLRVYKLARLLWRTWTTEPEIDHRPPAAAPSAEMERLNTAFSAAREEFRHGEMLLLKSALVDADPATPVYHYGLMLGLLIDHERAEEEQRFFTKALGVELAQTPLTEQEEMLRRFRDENPDEFASYRMLTSFLARVGGRDADEERVLLEAIERPAVAGFAALRMAQFHRARGRSEQSLAWLERAEALIPSDPAFRAVLGDFAFRDQRYSRAARLYEQALELRLARGLEARDVEYRQVALAHSLANDELRARMFFDLDTEIQLGRSRETTRTNYIRLARLVQAHGAHLIAMQYPMLSIWPLRKMLATEEGVLFVDNENTFRAAVAERDYGHYFSDHFAGAFGHLRAPGNELIAHNLAPSLLGLLPPPAAAPERLPDVP